MLCCRGWCEFFETFVDWSWRETCNRFASATLCHPTILCVCWRVQLFMCSCNASWPFPVAGLTVILSLQSTAFTITMLMLCDADDVAECAIGISAALGSMSSRWKGMHFAHAEWVKSKKSSWNAWREKGKKMEKGQKTRWKTSSESSLLLKTHCFIASHFTLRVVLHRCLFVVAEPSAASASAARGPSLRAHRGRSLRFSAERFRCTDAWKNKEKYMNMIEYVQILRWIWKILIFRNTTFCLFFWNHLKFNQKDRWSSPPPRRSPEMICRTCRSPKASSAKMLWVAVQTNLYTFYVSTFPSLTSTRCSNWLQIVLILLRLAVYEQGFSDLCLRRCFWPLHVHSYFMNTWQVGQSLGSWQAIPMKWDQCDPSWCKQLSSVRNDYPNGKWSLSKLSRLPWSALPRVSVSHPLEHVPRNLKMCSVVTWSELLNCDWRACEFW